MGIPVTLIVIVDSILLKSIFGVVLQGVVLIVSIVGFSRTENKGENYMKYIQINNDEQCKVA